MRNGFVGLWIVLAAWIIAAPAYAQQIRQPPAKSAAPAPRRDISGVWSGGAFMQLESFAEMTPWAQKYFDGVKPLFGPRAVPVAESTDPLVMCDPLGFPRNVLYELRNVEFAQLKNKVLQLFQYQRIWREIWTDGRKLPTTVGGKTADAPDPRYYGYSIGEWIDDFTFVVHSTGFHEAPWGDEYGHPRSVSAKIEERYHRIDHDTLELTVTIDDPTAYAKPFVAMKQPLHWNPKQEFEEQLCVPSEAADYLSTFKPVADK